VRYFFHIGFNGGNYRGWQRQTNAHKNVQQVMETALSNVLKVPISIIGCGRTDAGVHASQFFFHVDIEQSWDFDMLFRINKVLPNDIAVFDIIPVGDRQHARFDATHRTYDYFIHTYKNPFINTVSAFYDAQNVDLKKMKQGATLLLRYQNYRSLCKTPNANATTICRVSSAKLWTDEKRDHFRFQITANRFLGKMVRIIVAKLLAIGHGELSIDTFESYLSESRPAEIFETAHPQGLFLSKVTYPLLDIPPRIDFSRLIQAPVDEWQLV
jgi:tRNA pseudouridine38-40 synthase